MGKALFHAADANGGLDELFATLDGADEIVVVTGLGGGTGSGVAPDLARALDRHARVSLLGLLPTDEDDGAGTANAHATLSELEYCWLTDQSPFDDVVLPSPPVTEPGLRQAAVHALVGWVNVTQPQFRPSTASGPPDHAPFTVAVPAVSRLVVPGLEEAQDRLDATLEKRREPLDVELTLYDELEALLPHLFDAFETRLDAPERLLDEADHVGAVFDALDDAVVARLADRLKSLRSGLDGDGVDAPADRRAAGLHDCIETELRALGVRIRLLAAATAFERPELAQVLQSLLDTESRLPPEARRLRDGIRLGNEEHREHIDQLDAVREAAAAAIEVIAHEWVATTDAEAASWRWKIVFRNSSPCWRNLRTRSWISRRSSPSMTWRA